MTDEEILKAFQLCNTDTDCDTNGCPYNDMVEDCISMLNNDIISRFNELKAANAALRERLRKAVKDVAERIENALFREFADDMTFKMASRIEEVIKAELKGGDHE